MTYISLLRLCSHCIQIFTHCFVSFIVSNCCFSFQGVIILDANGESCDGDIEGDNDDEKEPVECSNNFVFVGAEIRTGKSSIRSKQSKKARAGVVGLRCYFV